MANEPSVFEPLKFNCNYKKTTKIYFLIGIFFFFFFDQIGYFALGQGPINSPWGTQKKSLDTHCDLDIPIQNISPYLYVSLVYS